MTRVRSSEYRRPTQGARALIVWGAPIDLVKPFISQVEGARPCASRTN